MFLHDERRQRIFEVPPGGARLGRDPDVEMAFPDEETLVSAVHARVFFRDDGSWWLEDLGSTNGTWIRGKRISEPVRLRSGDRFSFGQRGPQIAVNVPGDVKRTQEERPVDVSRPLLRLRRVKGGEDLIANGSEIVLGRGADCAIPLRTVADTVVSKHHAVVEIEEAGAAMIRDLNSKNGTWVNGEQVTDPRALRVGDRIMLGWHGPLFEVRIIGAAAMPENQGAEYRPRLQPPKTLDGMLQSARELSRAVRGPTVARTVAFVRSMGRQMLRESSAVFRVVVLTILVALAVAVGYVWNVATHRAVDAEERLASAERAFTEQLRSATATQQRAEAEINQLTRELTAARRNAVSRSVLDSLARRLREAETAAAQSAPDVTRIASENGPAVGLVVVRFGGDSTMGTGFAITRSGYFVTNRHVVDDPDRGTAPRSIEVTMADTRTPLIADLVSVSTVREQDIAILRLRGFRGEPVRAIDWAGRDVRQGSAAVLIGFPGGIQLALDARGFLRTTLFTGIISKSPGDWLQFGGTSLQGSSGSPIFNAMGEVIAVHFGGYSGGPGVGFSVPVARVRRWLPPDARAELGI